MSATAETAEAETSEARARPRGGARGGRPTKAAAAERDERLLDIATRMFLEQGFDATSMDGLAEAAAIGKATLYARYADKTALFADVLRRRILEVYGPIEEEFSQAKAGTELEDVLRDVATALIERSLAESAVTLGRILAAQGPRFPDLARLAIKEGYGRQLRLIESILARYAADPRYALDDVPMAADLFLSLVLGPASRFKIYGLGIDLAAIRRRTAEAARIFVRGIAA